MQNIIVKRYTEPSVTQSWQGYIEPDDLSWIMFVDAEGKPTVFLNRDPVTGAVK